MIVHSQLFDAQTKRPLADYSCSHEPLSTISEDAFGSRCEELMQPISSYSMSTVSVLEDSSDFQILGQEVNSKFYVICILRKGDQSEVG